MFCKATFIPPNRFAQFGCGTYCRSSYSQIESSVASVTELGRTWRRKFRVNQADDCGCACFVQRVSGVIFTLMRLNYLSVDFFNERVCCNGWATVRPQRQSAVDMPHLRIALTVQPLRGLKAALATAAYQHQSGGLGFHPGRWKRSHRSHRTDGDIDCGQGTITQATASLVLCSFTNVEQARVRVLRQESA